MNWFKKKQNPEICGYLDVSGQFFKYKDDRDYSNYEIELANVKYRLELNLKYIVQNADGLEFIGFDIHNVNNFIEQAAKSQQLTKMIRAYNNYLNDVKDLKVKYNQT